MTEKIGDLLSWIFANITSSMAFDYELKTIIKDRDCRQIMFEKQEELLGQLNED